MQDPYVYKNSSVLINLQDIHDQSALDEYENIITSLAIAKLIQEGMDVNSLNDVFVVHKNLFENVYEWAGKTRTINIYKNEPILNGLSVEYSDHKNIKKEINKLDKEFKKYDFVKMSKNDIVTNITYYMSALWKIHPFREGNTRAISTLMCLLAKKINLKLDVDFIAKHAKYFRNALVLNSIGEYAEPQHLQSFLSDALMVKIYDDSNDKYKNINGYELDKYQYGQHSYKE